ncbi:MAG: hypothetical protein CL693_12325 [Cellvibrionaceae bacterium]|nr:hypothetical protein [Cellvibrionaceae bacterium]|tara:strand:- start:17049 stop:17306 length:258 start_codon:yes stop_codon:yes gene_type:complete
MQAIIFAYPNIIKTQKSSTNLNRARLWRTKTTPVFGADKMIQYRARSRQHWGKEKFSAIGTVSALKNIDCTRDTRHTTIWYLMER